MIIVFVIEVILRMGVLWLGIVEYTRLLEENDCNYVKDVWLWSTWRVQVVSFVVIMAGMLYWGFFRQCVQKYSAAKTITKAKDKKGNEKDRLYPTLEPEEVEDANGEAKTTKLTVDNVQTYLKAIQKRDGRCTWTFDVIFIVLVVIEVALTSAAGGALDAIQYVNATQTGGTENTCNQDDWNGSNAMFAALTWLIVAMKIVEAAIGHNWVKSMRQERLGRALRVIEDHKTSPAETPKVIQDIIVEQPNKAGGIAQATRLTKEQIAIRDLSSVLKELLDK